MIADYDHNYDTCPDNQSSDDDGSKYVSANPKKKKRNLNRREVNKRSNLAGQEYQSARKKDGEFKLIPAKPRRDERCRCNCNMKLTNREKENIYKQFRALKSREAQNSLLRGLTSIHGYNLKGKVYDHSLNLPHKTIHVCQKYWIGIFGITSRSSILAKILDQCSSPSDGRGCHGNHPRMETKCKGSIRRFLGTFPNRSSHYSREDNLDKKYLDSHLSIAELHRMYKVLHPEYAEKVKYSFFANIYNTEFNYSFSLPRSDICETCDNLHKEIAALQISGSAEDVRNADQRLKNHWTEAEAFYHKLKQARQCDDKSKVAICVDYEKQQPIPKTNIGPEFYKSQLMLQTFCVENIKTGDSTFYIYPENFSSKGSEEVVAFLNDYIQDLPPETKELTLFADNCGGQNKNRNVFAFFQNLANSNRFDKISIEFPIPGHSRLPCDRIFGLLQKHLSKFEKILQPSDYITCIKKCKTTKPILIKYVNFSFTDNLKTDGTQIVIVKTFETKLNDLLIPASGNIQKIRSMKFVSNADPCISYTVQQIEWEQLLLIKDNVLPETLNSVFVNAPRKQIDFLKLPRNKYNCIKYLLKSQIIPSSTIFFTSLYPDPEDPEVQNKSKRKTTMKNTTSTKTAIENNSPNNFAPLQLPTTCTETNNSIQQGSNLQAISLGTENRVRVAENAMPLSPVGITQFNFHQFSVRPRAQLRYPLSNFQQLQRPGGHPSFLHGQNPTGVNFMPRFVRLPIPNISQVVTPRIITPLRLQSPRMVQPQHCAPNPTENPNSQQ